MHLKISKIRYNSKHGVSIDFDRPGTVQLTPEQAYALYHSSNSDLTEQELEQHFSKAEQLVLFRYHDLVYEKMLNPDPTCAERGRKGSLQKEVTKMIDSFMEYFSEGKRSLIEKYLGWKLPSGYEFRDQWFYSDPEDDEWLGQ